MAAVSADALDDRGRPHEVIFRMGDAPTFELERFLFEHVISHDRQALVVRFNMLESTVEADSTNTKSSLRSLIQRLAFVMVGTIFFGLVVPAMTAAYSGVFFLENLKTKVGTTHPEVVRAWEQFKEEQVRLTGEIKNIEILISSSGASESTILELIRQKREFERELDKPAPVSLQPYYIHIISYCWPVMFFCLCIVAFFAHPADSASEEKRGTTIFFAFLIFLAFVLPLCARTIYAATSGHGRIVYAYSNPDISLPSFVVQIINNLIQSLLLGLIWQQWVTYAILCRRKVVKMLQHIDSDCEIDLAILRDVSSLLLRWQFVFVMVSIGFSIYSAIFWTQIVRAGDTRFMFEALIGQFLWVVTLFLVALPLIITWQGWNSYKSKIVGCFLNKDWSGDNKYNDKLSVVRDLSPIGSWNVVATGITVVSSLLLPIVQAFIKSEFG
jgi:hypothetical protein